MISQYIVNWIIKEETPQLLYGPNDNQTAVYMIGRGLLLKLAIQTDVSLHFYSHYNYQYCHILRSTKLLKNQETKGVRLSQIYEHWCMTFAVSIDRN